MFLLSEKGTLRLRQPSPERADNRRRHPVRPNPRIRAPPPPQAFTEEDYIQQETVTLTLIPCWKHLTPEGYSSQSRAVADQITTEAAAERARIGRQHIGVKAVLRQKPGTRLEKVKKSPAPYFHALRKSVRRLLYEAYFLFVAEYRDASEKLRSGDRTASFPLGCFPPALPFGNAVATPTAA